MRDQHDIIIVQTSITASSQLKELMKDNEKVELLGPCIDHLFSMCCMQYRLEHL